MCQPKETFAFTQNRAEHALGKVLVPDAKWQLGEPLNLLDSVAEEFDLVSSILPMGARAGNPLKVATASGEHVELRDDLGNLVLVAGKVQQIPHDVNAQCLAAFHGLPAIGYKDKGKVFSTHRDEVFPPQIRPEEIVLVWQAGKVAKELVKRELEEAIANEDKNRVAILKRGAAFFILAIMGVILHERNGQTFLNKLKPEVAASKATGRRLENYATISLEWYVEIVTQLVAGGEEVASLVRSQTGWQKMKPNILSRWKVYRLAPKTMEESLPKL